LNIFALYFTRTFGVQIYAKLQSIIQLFLISIKLCHIMRVRPANFLFSLESPL